MSWDVGEELCSFSNLSVTSPTSQLILQPFRRFTYATAHSPTISLLHLRHSSFSNPSFASPKSQALRLIFTWRAAHAHQFDTQKWVNGFQRNLVSALKLYRSKLCTTFHFKLFKGVGVLGWHQIDFSRQL